MSTRVAVVLAAGVGSRLRPLTDDRPKALVDLGGETILGRAVRQLVEYGVERVVVATGYRQDAIARALAETPVTVALCPNPRYDSTQNAVSLALCSPAVAGDGFFKLDGDVVFDAEVLPRLDAEQCSLAVAVDTSRSLDAEAMKVRVSSSNRIVAFGKDIALAESAGESIGIERVSSDLSPRLFEALDGARTAGRVDLYYEDVYSELIAAGLEAGLVDVSDLGWGEVDDHVDLEAARRLVR